MTATSAFTGTTCPAPSRRARARGIDRIIIRASLATLRWARRRADRAQLGRDEIIARHELSRELERREHDAALRYARIR